MSKTTKNTAITIAAIAALAAIAGCDSQNDPSGASTENSASSALWQHYEQVQPPYQPTGKSVYRDNLNLAEADQVLGLNTTTFFFQNGSRIPIFWCPSHGGAVPDTAQLTNPSYVEPDPNASRGSVIIGNMDPNGVYAPTSSAGTYVQCEDTQGRPYLVYAEPDVMQISAPAIWDPKANGGQGGIVVTGAPVMPVCTVGTYQGQAATLCTAPTTPVAAPGTGERAPATAAAKPPKTP